MFAQIAFRSEANDHRRGSADGRFILIPPADDERVHHVLRADDVTALPDDVLHVLIHANARTRSMRLPRRDYDSIQVHGPWKEICHFLEMNESMNAGALRLRVDQVTAELTRVVGQLSHISSLWLRFESGDSSDPVLWQPLTNIVRLTLESRYWHSISLHALAPAQRLRALDLRSVRAVPDEQAGLPNLQHLRLDDPITSLVLRGLREFNSLGYLCIRIEDAGSGLWQAELARLPALRHLYICSSESIDLASVLVPAPWLEELELELWLDAELSASMPRDPPPDVPPALRMLTVQGGERVTASAWNYVATLTAIVGLKLAIVSEVDTAGLARVLDAVDVEVLALGPCADDPVVWEALAGCTALTELRIRSSKHLGDDVLFELASHGTLQVLELSSNTGYTEAGLERLLSIAGLRSITLHSEQWLGQRVLVAIAEHATGLEVLDLRFNNNRIPADGVVRILENTAITRLVISWRPQDKELLAVLERTVESMKATHDRSVELKITGLR